MQVQQDTAGIARPLRLQPKSIAAISGGQDAYARKFADELQHAGVKPHDVWPQSFNVSDVLSWINNSPYGKQAVFLVDYDATKDNILLSIGMESIGHR